MNALTIHNIIMYYCYLWCFLTPFAICHKLNLQLHLSLCSLFALALSDIFFTLFSSAQLRGETRNGARAAAKVLHGNWHVPHTFTYDLPYGLEECIAEISSAVRQHINLLRATLQLRSQMNQLPKEVGVHVLGGAGTHLNLSHRYEHLIADDLHLILSILARNALKKIKRINFTSLQSGELLTCAEWKWSG